MKNMPFYTPTGPSFEILVARWTTKRLDERLAATPSCGPFYVVCVPRQWVVIAFREDEFRGEPGHVELWTGENGLAAWLSEVWAVHLKCTKARLWAVLEDCCYGFPRGRVVEHEGMFKVFHGADVIPGVPVTHRRVERLFGLGRKVAWHFDEHERCQRGDVERIRGLLDIRETWKSVE